MHIDNIFRVMGTFLGYSL